MIKNYLKIAWRNLFKNKGYFLINVLGLSLALTVSFLLLLWVYDEYSMDKFHANNDQLFRVKRTIPLEEGVFEVYESAPYQLLKTAKEQIPEIEQYITIGRSFEDNLEVDNTDYRATGTFANSGLFASFSFPVLIGDITQLDKKPEAIAISQNLAKRFWGENWMQQAIGSTVTIHDNGDFMVEAVYENLPRHSSIQNDFYFSFDKYLKDNQWMLEWGNNGMQGAFLLQKKANVQEVSAKLNTLFQNNIEGEVKEGCFLQKFSDDYLYGEFNEKAQVSGGRIEYVQIFTWAAIFLLIISCINFVNLSTAYATKRAGEIGVRKVIGARKNTLISQFMTETTLITFISFVIAYMLTFMLLPSINVFAGKNLAIGATDLGIWISILLVFIITTLLSGIYPAIVISSFKPISALKGMGKEKKNTISFRKGLVVLQFGLSILLIVVAIVVKQQVNFINQKDLGLEKDHIVSIHQDQKLTDKYEVLHNELIASNGITDVTLVGPSPLDMGASTSGVSWAGKREDQEHIEFSMLWTAHNFPDVFEISLSDGSYYKEGTVDTLNIVLNQKAVEIMNIQDPVGKTIEVWGSQRQIIGVLKDFHNRSLYEAIQPSIFFLDPKDAGAMFVKLKANETKNGLTSLESIFTKVLPDVPLHYSFVDEEYATKYKSETLTGSLTYYFALISIFISCMGLFGLAAFMAKERIKEIGIRKVLGASVGNITALLSKDFLKLVVIAFLIASPLAYFLTTNWLEDFAYKIEVQWWVFAMAGGFALIITLITVGFQSIKSAIVNPVKSLQTE
ncbi:ABC-type antimicrobial peptide transport system permease subunit [Saonia flava]|uniref:ABC-type antimicrobial peptide transport system permease subunit n=1 Tax=Saonia flava TaxID=523696 RepID=A0A846QYL8_9FLAO|nr:FtsX-like permease family protein [Saonia flava]NJB70224.1 ABC-type antimicrobial peptide transport system permease subunit [Saonia flava]